MKVEKQKRKKDENMGECKRAWKINKSIQIKNELLQKEWAGTTKKIY